jgi:hypothetical protein
LRQEERFDADENMLKEFDPEAALMGEEQKVEEEFQRL